MSVELDDFDELDASEELDDPVAPGEFAVFDVFEDVPEPAESDLAEAPLSVDFPSFPSLDLEESEPLPPLRA